MNSTFYSPNDYRNYIAHFGVKGMRWGVRRYQNTNGSYTSAGKKRYGVGDGKSYKSVSRGGKGNMTDEQRAARRAKIKKAALMVGGAAALAGGAYLGAKYGRGALQAYRSGGWNVEGKGMHDVHGKYWRGAQKDWFRGRQTFDSVHRRNEARDVARGMKRAAKYKAQDIGRGVAGAAQKVKNGSYVRGAANAVKNAVSNAATNVRGRFSKTPRLPDASLKIPGRGDAMRRAASNAAGRVRNAASNAAFNARSAGVAAGNAARNAAANVRGRFSKTPRLPGTALKVPGRGDAVRRAASNAASRVRGAASNAAFNARSAKVAAGNAARNAATNIRGRFSKTPRLPNTGLKVPGRGDAVRRAASNAASRVRGAASNAAFNARSARVAAGNAAKNAVNSARASMYKAGRYNPAGLPGPSSRTAAGARMRNAASAAAGRVRGAVGSAANKVRNMDAQDKREFAAKAAGAAAGAAIGGYGAYRESKRRDSQGNSTRRKRR